MESVTAYEQDIRQLYTLLSRFEMQDDSRQADIELTPEMLDAGAKAMRMWISDCGQDFTLLDHRAVRDAFWAIYELLPSRLR